MLAAREAAEYCGLPVKQLPVRPVEMPGGKVLYDIRDLDRWLDALKDGAPDDADEIIGKLR